MCITFLLFFFSPCTIVYEIFSFCSAVWFILVSSAMNYFMLYSATVYIFSQCTWHLCIFSCIHQLLYCPYFQSRWILVVLWYLVFVFLKYSLNMFYFALYSINCIHQMCIILCIFCMFQSRPTCTLLYSAIMYIFQIMCLCSKVLW